MLEFGAYIFSSLAAIWFTAFTPVHAQPTRCGAHTDYRYCVYAGSPKSHRILYVLHGLGHDERGWSWNPVSVDVDKAWEKEGWPKPHIVTISRGKLWSYVDRDEGDKMAELVRWIEPSLNLVAPAERVLMGDSMGGHNALRWAADYPGLFRKLALTCPALPGKFMDPARTVYGSWFFGLLAEALLSGRYANSKLPDANPIRAASNIPSVYLAVATADKFGFDLGGHALREMLAKNTSAELIFEEQAVRHCDIRSMKLAHFLAR